MRKPPEAPGGPLAAAIVEHHRRQGSASAGVVGAALPVAAMTVTGHDRRPCAEAWWETVLLALVEALVERLRGIGEPLQPRSPRGHRVRALAQPPDRIQPGPARVVTARLGRRAPCARSAPHALGAILGQIADRRLDRGQFFSCSAVSFNPALRLAMRASVSAVPRRPSDSRGTPRGDIACLQASCLLSKRKTCAPASGIVPAKISSSWPPS